MQAGPFTVLLMAGSRGPSDVVASHCGVTHKALAPLAGRPMIEHVLQALVAAPEVGQILAVIEDPEALRRVSLARELEDAGRLRICLARPSPSQSVLAVLDEFQPYPALITTADHPLLTPEMIREFVGELPKAVDVAALVARDHVICARYPHVKRTYLRFSDAAVSGCNLFALLTPASRGVAVFWRQLERERKRPWRMALALGPLTLLRFALKRLTLRQAVDGLGARAGVRATVLESSFADAAVDVDKVSDYDLVQSVLGQRAG